MGIFSSILIKQKFCPGVRDEFGRNFEAPFVATDRAILSSIGDSRWNLAPRVLFTWPSRYDVNVADIALVSGDIADSYNDTVSGFGREGE